MSRETLSEDEVRSEVDRLLKLLEWARSKEGVDYHVYNINTSHKYGILAGFLEQLVNDGIELGLNPAYVIGYLGLRIWGQHPELRDDLNQVLNFDALDYDIFLDKEMADIVMSRRKRRGSEES